MKNILRGTSEDNIGLEAHLEVAAEVPLLQSVVLGGGEGKETVVGELDRVHAGLVAILARKSRKVLIVDANILALRSFLDLPDLKKG